MSLGKLEKEAKATDVCEVLLQHALKQTHEKEWQGVILQHL